MPDETPVDFAVTPAVEPQPVPVSASVVEPVTETTAAVPVAAEVVPDVSAPMAEDRSVAVSDMELTPEAPATTEPAIPAPEPVVTVAAPAAVQPVSTGAETPVAESRVTPEVAATAEPETANGGDQKPSLWYWSYPGETQKVMAAVAIEDVVRAVNSNGLGRVYTSQQLGVKKVD